jgi:hypothetical protein
MKNNYEIERKENESIYFYKIRKLFIELLKPPNKKKKELYTMYSHIFINMFILKCRYKESTEIFIYNFLKKNKKKFVSLLNIS